MHSPVPAAGGLEPMLRVSKPRVLICKMAQRGQCRGSRGGQVGSDPRGPQRTTRTWWAEPWPSWPTSVSTCQRHQPW